MANVIGDIARLLTGRDALDPAGLDAAMRAEDGTPNLARLGGNATLAVSLACARAGAVATGQPLWRRFAELAGTNPTMPLPMVNILSGGLHAGRGMDVQDFLVMPVGADSYAEALEWIGRVRAAATRCCAEAGLPTLLADEGGLSPGFERSEQALDLMMRSFEAAGLHAGDEVAIALDIASSSLIDDEGRYPFLRAGETYDAAAMIDLQSRWVDAYPIVSIEDGLGEDDWTN